MDPRVSAARFSVLSNSLLVVAKLAVGLSIHSVSIISEAIHSGLDLVAAGIAFWSVQQAAKPADRTHRYGHGKIENLSGAAEALLIFVASAWIIFEGYHRLRYGGEMEAVTLGLVVMGGSAVLNLAVSRHLFSVAKKTDSMALEADAMHLSTDVYTSLGVFGGLILIHFTGLSWLDPVVAIAVALLIMKAAYDLLVQAILPLSDVKLPDVEEAEIARILNRHAAEYVEWHDLRTRKAGSERHIDLHLVAHRSQSLGYVHNLCDRMEDEIQSRFPGASVLIHPEPCGGDCPVCSGTSFGEAPATRNPAVSDESAGAPDD